MITPNIIELENLTEKQRKSLYLRTESDLSAYLEKVGAIIEKVRNDGDRALVECAQLYDRADVRLDNLKVSEAEFDEAFAEISTEVLEAITFAVENVRKYHEAQLPEMWLKEIRPGAFAGERHVPIDSAACYVPRGKASYPSSVVMVAVPAVVAGVRQPVIITPPREDGKIDPTTLVAAKLSGITDVYKAGGAQAVAAAAFGTEIIPKCEKFLGPGSPWVMAAKQLLSSEIDPGIPAGPSESIIFADETANGKTAALDMVIESEHGDDSSVFLVTNSRRVAEEVVRTLPEVWAQLSEQRRKYSQAVICGPKGGVLLASDISDAIDFVNGYAPEHLEVLSVQPFEYLGLIHHASEILLGENTPVSIANFVLGPNAVLPTSGKARTISPLSVFDYMKRQSIGYVTKTGLPQLARHGQVFAHVEGFDAHGLALSNFRETLRKAK